MIYLHQQLYQHPFSSSLLCEFRLHMLNLVWTKTFMRKENKFFLLTFMVLLCYVCGTLRCHIANMVHILRVKNIVQFPFLSYIYIFVLVLVQMKLHDTKKVFLKYLCLLVSISFLSVFFHSTVHMKEIFQEYFFFVKCNFRTNNESP
jgi:hypothetical protein